jgi:hypothetical protein
MAGKREGSGKNILIGFYYIYVHKQVSCTEILFNVELLHLMFQMKFINFFNWIYEDM